MSMMPNSIVPDNRLAKGDIYPKSESLANKQVLTTPAYHDDIASEVRRAQSALNTVLIDAARAGIKVEAEVFSLRTVGSKLPQTKIEINLYKELSE